MGVFFETRKSGAVKLLSLTVLKGFVRVEELFYG